MKKYEIIIYDEWDGLPSHLVETLEEASRWIGVSVQALYKSFHLTGKMRARGYLVERFEK